MSHHAIYPGLSISEWYMCLVRVESPGSEAKATQTCCLIHARLIKQDRFIIERKIGTSLFLVSNGLQVLSDQSILLPTLPTFGIFLSSLEWNKFQPHTNPETHFSRKWWRLMKIFLSVVSEMVISIKTNDLWLYNCNLIIMTILSDCS